MRCSIRTDRSAYHGERRRRFGVVSPPFLSRKGGEEGREGKQDKGSVSRHCASDCLHILFPRDRRWATRDMASRNGANLPFLARNRETPGRRDARSEERSVGKEGVSTCRSRWSQNH